MEDFTNSGSIQDDSKPVKTKLNRIYKIVCWCSGARLYLLENCPADFNKYFGIGAVVIMTGIMASISGGYALYTVFENYFLSVFFGLLWGILIFSIDWYIVASLRKENHLGREILSATPRIILAILIGIVISKPIELKLFEKEINQELVIIKQENKSEFNSLINEEFNDIEKLEQKNKNLLSEIETKEKYRRDLFDLIIEEAEGRSPTNKVGKGPVYKEKKDEFDRINIEIEQIKTQNLKQINENLLQIKELQKRKNENLVKSEIVNSEYGGFLGRINSLDRLARANRSIKLVNWFIILLFVFIESAPMIVKLLSRRGPYDIIFEKEEQFNTIIAGNLIDLTKEKELENLKANEEIYKFRNQLFIDSEKKFIKAVFETKEHLNELKVNKWKEKKSKEITETIDEKLDFIDNIANSDNKINN